MYRHIGGYDFPPFRPPNEAESGLIRISYSNSLENIRTAVKKIESVMSEI